MAGKASPEYTKQMHPKMLRTAYFRQDKLVNWFKSATTN